MTARRLAATFALVVAALVGAEARQDGDGVPQFRSGVTTIAVHATVVDRYGALVTDLSEDEFEVFDNGRQQELTVFGRGLQPITAVVLVDTSASMTPVLERARLAAEQFVIRLLPEDEAMVGSFSDRVDLSPAFTRDRDSLLYAIREGLHVGNPTRLWDALTQAMDALQEAGGRRIVLLLSDGEDTQSDARASEVLERLRTEEIMVYVVQFRTGQARQVERLVAASGLFRDTSREIPPTEALRDLSQQTGGGHFVLDQYDNINATFTQVAQELRDQYTLGFTPTRLDGRVHRLEVRVTRRATTVRARRTYLAPLPTPD